MFDLISWQPDVAIQMKSKHEQLHAEAFVQRCYVKKMFLEILQNSQEIICEFWEISKNTFSYIAPPVAASVCE